MKTSLWLSFFLKMKYREGIDTKIFEILVAAGVRQSFACNFSVERDDAGAIGEGYEKGEALGEDKLENYFFH